MAHEKREFFVECMNTATYNFVRMNIVDLTDQTKFHQPAKVEVIEQNVTKIIEKELIEIDKAGVQKLRENKKGLKLSFNLFMRESHGAKITPWFL